MTKSKLQSQIERHAELDSVSKQMTNYLQTNKQLWNKKTEIHVNSIHLKLLEENTYGL